MGELKMYVWENVLVDYTSGMAAVLAHDADEARRLILAELEGGGCDAEFEVEPIEVSEPRAFYVYGGG